MIDDLNNIPEMQSGGILTAEGHWNPMREAVGRPFSPGEGSAGPAGIALSQSVQTPELPFLFRNDSGVSIPAYGVFVGDEVVVVSGRAAVKAELPTSTVESHVWINRAHAVPANGYGWCTRANCVPTKALCSTGSAPAKGDLAAPSESTFTLVKNSAGVLKILETPDANNLARVIMQIKPPFLYGKLDGALAAAGSATCSIWSWSGSAWTDSTVDLTVYAPPLLSSGSIAITKWVRIEYCRGSARWEVVSAEC